MDPVISIIIPCYNQAHYLTHALHSVLAQTFSNWEAIVVDDGSTDDTASVASQFTDPRIRYIYQENRGLSGARNTGVRAAQTETIALLDSDDLWKPEFLEKMVTLLDSHPEAAAVYCGFQYINSQGQSIGSWPALKVVPPDNFHKILTYEGNWLVPCAVVFRKQLAEEVGLFDESLKAVEDTDLWIRLSTHNKFIGLPEVLVYYRRHDDNMTKDPEHMMTAIQQLAEKMYGPPKENASSWPEAKRLTYIRLYRNGVRSYLASGDIPTSAHYFQKLVELSLDAALDMGTWRTLARVHLPVEYRDDPFAKLDWTLAQRDILGLLDELAGKAASSAPLQKQYSRIKGNAFLALAEEAVRANDLKRAYGWLWRVGTSSPALLFSRPYWGTVGRSIISAKKSIKVQEDE